MNARTLAPLLTVMLLAGCSKSTPDCKGSAVVCGDSCVQLKSDNLNCGVCGTACAAGKVCSAGACAETCAAGATACPAVAPTYCADVTTDESNCGTCGTACTTGQACTAGVCSLVCAGGTTKCGSSCVTTTSDPTNCGACGTVCTSGQVCSAGACSLTCAGGTTKCGSSCVVTTTDPANCGACGTVCLSSAACVNSACVPLLISQSVVFPATTSTTRTGTLGAGGWGWFQTGDYVQSAFARTESIRQLSLNFLMSDATSGCAVGTTLTWAVKVNGTQVGTYSWTGGQATGDKTLAPTFGFAPMAPVSGTFTLRLEALTTVCSGGGSWNWKAGGTATVF